MIFNKANILVVDDDPDLSEGNDECDPAHGSGWLKIKEKGLLEGEFRFHAGDDSIFLARRAE